jgi:hypothetical protein
MMVFCFFSSYRIGTASWVGFGFGLGFVGGLLLGCGAGLLRQLWWTGKPPPSLFLLFYFHFHFLFKISIFGFVYLNSNFTCRFLTMLIPLVLLKESLYHLVF